MESNERSVGSQTPAGCKLAPIHASGGCPLSICVVVRAEPQTPPNPFILLRELPGARVYLGALCDTAAHIQEWLEIRVQTLELRDLAFSGYQERVSNHAFDQRWGSEWAMTRERLRASVITTGMEDNNPSPMLIRNQPGSAASPFLPVETSKWRLCRDDSMLGSFGLPPYSTSPFRYLHEPEASGVRTFLATSADAPANSHVQEISHLSADGGVLAVFNPHAGFVRVSSLHPLELEDYLRILEGESWDGSAAGDARIFPGGAYAELRAWSSSPKGLPFLLHGAAHPVEHLNEIFFLKLSALLGMFKEVRTYVKTQQLPLLNLFPSSFRISLPESGDQFPALWGAKCELVTPGQAYPLKIRSTEQKYFIRLGRIQPSPFLPEGLGAHSFGIGGVRIRNVATEAGGVLFEGTLVAEDYLSIDPYDLLWFKLPVGEERLEFYAHVYPSENVGPKEARFRTVPAQLPESAADSLKRLAGTVFPKSPYEVWPLLSSPCDLFSLGVMAVRILLANVKTNLPVTLDEVLSLARQLGGDPGRKEDPLAVLKSLVTQDERLFDLVSPHALLNSESSPAQARSQIHLDLWLETIVLVLRLFPGTSSQSFCRNFGDVSPLALETVFDRPVQELETMVLRLRSVLVPSLSANEEIARVVLDQLRDKPD